MKKVYTSPDMEIVRIGHQDVLVASKYTHDPEIAVETTDPGSGFEWD